MTNNAVAITAIVMSGLFLIAVVWQLLSVARTAVRNKNESNRHLQERLAKLEDLHVEPSPTPNKRNTSTEGIPEQ